LWYFLFTSVAAQLSLKASGLHAVKTSGIVDAWLLNPYLLATLACYGISFACWARTLKTMPLSAAYPWTAIIYVLTPAAAVLLWREQLSATYLAGMVCILCGIGIIVKTG
jgi:multidrug transporter EmrE-like cation transporter